MLHLASSRAAHHDKIAPSTPIVARSALSRMVASNEASANTKAVRHEQRDNDDDSVRPTHLVDAHEPPDEQANEEENDEVSNELRKRAHAEQADHEEDYYPHNLAS